MPENRILHGKGKRNDAFALLCLKRPFVNTVFEQGTVACSVLLPFWSKTRRVKDPRGNSSLPGARFRVFLRPFFRKAGEGRVFYMRIFQKQEQKQTDVMEAQNIEFFGLWMGSGYDAGKRRRNSRKDHRGFA